MKRKCVVNLSELVVIQMDLSEVYESCQAGRERAQYNAIGDGQRRQAHRKVRNNGATR